jgi:hypothetical protein
MLRNMFRERPPQQWKIVEKDLVDEIIFRTPIEIVSKVILRHAHLSTTQRYLGKFTDVEAMRWIENLYG